jgi:tRNA (guanine6-N2)-methyltransferase
MAKQRSPEPLPPCYAMVMPGLEPVAADEIARELGGKVKRSAPGINVFRLSEIDEALLQLRTTEDVFLLAWGTDKLTHRSEDLDRIRRWTAHEVNWNRLLSIHHALRPKPKGKPTYHLVTQMSGKHVYRRIDARKALIQGLAGKLPASWRLVDENAAVEIWLTIQGGTAVCGLRLSDRTMRHRTWKQEHLPASLRPTLAAAMVRLAEIKPNQVVLDPMCGAGTLLAEAHAWAKHNRNMRITVWGGDRDHAALRAACANLRRLGPVQFAHWDARVLPLPDQSVDRIVSNPPFGKQLSRPDEIGRLYQRMIRAYDRVLKPGGRAVLLVSDLAALRAASSEVNWKSARQLRVRVLGEPAVVTVWRKET